MLSTRSSGRNLRQFLRQLSGYQGRDHHRQSGLTDIVAQRYDAGVRAGEQVAKDMIAVRIGPDIRMAVVGAPSYFRKRCRTEEAAGPDRSRLHQFAPVRRMAGLYAWEFEKAGSELKVRVEGQLVFNGTNADAQRGAGRLWPGLRAGRALARPHLAKGRLMRVLEDWCPTVFGLSPLLPEPPPVCFGVQSGPRFRGDQLADRDPEDQLPPRWLL